MVRQQGGIRFAVGPLVCLLAGFLSIFLFGRSAALAATPFSDLIVFGDSLSDNGNAGRFSNGPVWAERIAERMGLDLQPARSGGTNYAIGGARTHGGLTDVLSQTAAYLARRSVDPDALYIVFAGANDLLAAACRGMMPPMTQGWRGKRPKRSERQRPSLRRLAPFTSSFRTCRMSGARRWFAHGGQNVPTPRGA
jgi:phospholipase/lecithinase/hemolysin